MVAKDLRRVRLATAATAVGLMTELSIGWIKGTGRKEELGRTRRNSTRSDSISREGID